MSENMKPSRIAWIGDIPNSWEIKKLGLLCKQIGDVDHYMPDSVDEGVPYVMTGDFIGSRNEIDFENCKKISYKDFLTLSKKIKPQKGDILFARYATIGTVRYVETDIDFLVSYACLIVKAHRNSVDGKFLYHYFFSNPFNEEVAKYINANTQANVGSDSLNRVKISIPPLSEQTLIADFLDEQCKKIDSVATDIEKQIEVLQKYKKSLITETVTKGLDKSVPMKDSGIEWIGEIPEHWEVKRMQDVGTYKKGPFGSSITLDMFVDRDETTIKVYEQKNAIQGNSTLGWYYISYLDFKNLKEFEVFTGDIIVSCAGTMGKCYIMPRQIEKGIINQALMKITLSLNMNKQYFLYLFDIALEYMTDKYSNGSAIKNIPPFSVLKKENIPLPKFLEQTKIANYLDQQCSKIDSIIESKKEQLAKITQHKKSLIYEYVTGKKRVKEAKDNGN